MEDKSSEIRNLNSDFKNKNQECDYESLLIRLKNIKKNITDLENNFLFK